MFTAIISITTIIVTIIVTIIIVISTIFITIFIAIIAVFVTIVVISIIAFVLIIAVITISIIAVIAVNITTIMRSRTVRSGSEHARVQVRNALRACTRAGSERARTERVTLRSERMARHLPYVNTRTLVLADCPMLDYAFVCMLHV